jgi:hypothetical protein
MKPRNARGLNTWHPPAPDQEGWVHVTVPLRRWEYEQVLRIADAHGLVEADILRAALWQLLRDVAKTGFDRAERR